MGLSHPLSAASKRARSDSDWNAIRFFDVKLIYIYLLNKMDKYHIQKELDIKNRPNNRNKYYLFLEYIAGNVKHDDLVFIHITNDLKLKILPNNPPLLIKIDMAILTLKNYKYLNNKRGVYVLELQNKKYYIGSSRNIYNRLLQHWIDLGSGFTRTFNPTSIVEVFIIENGVLIDFENKITKEYKKKYGRKNVQGGNYLDYKK